MTSWHYMREGVNSAAGTYQAITNDGAGNALQDIDVPAGAQSIRQIGYSIGGAVTASWYGVVLKISGTGSRNGDQYIPLGGAHNIGTSVTSMFMGGNVQKVDIPVKPGKIQLSTSLVYNTDPGSPEVQVAITFSSEAGASTYYVVRANTADLAADTWTALATDGGGQTVNEISTPGAAKLIAQVITLSVGGNTAGVASHGFKLVSIGGAMKNGDSEAYFTGCSSIYGAGTLTASGLVNPNVFDADVPVGPGLIRTMYQHGGGDSDYPVGIIGVCYVE